MSWNVFNENYVNDLIIVSWVLYNWIYILLSYFYGVGESLSTKKTINYHNNPNILRFLSWSLRRGGREESTSCSLEVWWSSLMDGLTSPWISFTLSNITKKSFLLSYQTIFKKYRLDLIAYQFYIKINLEAKTLNKNWEENWIDS